MRELNRAVPLVFDYVELRLRTAVRRPDDLLMRARVRRNRGRAVLLSRRSSATHLRAHACRFCVAQSRGRRPSRGDRARGGRTRVGSSEHCLRVRTVLLRRVLRGCRRQQNSRSAAARHPEHTGAAPQGESRTRIQANMNLLRYLAALGIIALTACGSIHGGSPPAATSYTLTLAEIAGSGAPPVAAGPIVLYDAQFIDPMHSFALVGAIILPPPAQVPAATWNSSDPSVAVHEFQPNVPSPAPSAPPESAYAVAGTTYGMATVQARVGPPVNATASIPIYHFPSLSLGCHLRYTPAFAFDPGATPNGTASDLYDTIGSDQLSPIDPCVGTGFSTAAGTSEVWHAPYGGTFMPAVSLRAFPSIAASQWKNAGTTFTPAPGVLLFKTRGGLIVKAMLPIGPYEVSNSAGTFPY